MANLTELYGLVHKSELKNRVEMAVIIAAETIVLELPATDNHVNRLLWAKKVFSNPQAQSEPLFMAVLAANHASTVEQILGATQAQIQANVDEHVNLFADGS